MSDNQSDSVPSLERPVFNPTDAFDYSNEDAPDNSISFELDDDGELVVKSPETEDGESTESEESSAEENLITEEDLFSGVEDVQTQRIFKTLAEQNKKLEERLSKFEQEKIEREASRQLSETEQSLREKFYEEGFSESAVDLIFENMVLKNEVNKPDNNSEDPVEDPAERQLREAREVGEVIQRYNGKNGAPTPVEMQRLVEWTEQRLGPENFNGLTLNQVFRISENAPFIRYLDSAYPDKMRRLGPKEIVEISEKARIQWYKANKLNPEISYAHISMQLNGQGDESSTSNTGSTNESGTPLTNEQIMNMSNNNNRSLGVPGGTLMTEKDLEDRRKPVSAREAIERALSGFE